MKTCARVALLSRLELTDEEIDAQTKPLNDLLQQFELLQALDVTGIEPDFAFRTRRKRIPRGYRIALTLARSGACQRARSSETSLFCGAEDCCGLMAELYDLTAAPR